MATRRQAPPTSTMHTVASGAADKVAEAADTVKDGGRTFKQFMKKFYNDWSLHLTQALTFSLITSLIPLAMLLLVVVGDIIGTLNKQAKAELLKQVTAVLPPPLSSSSQDIVTSAVQKVPQSAGLLTFIAIIAALFFGSRLFTLLEACFDLIYRVPQRPFARKNLMALAMMVLFMVLTPVLVLTSLVPGQLVSLVQHTTSGDTPLLSRIMGVVSSLLVSFLLFEVIYTFIPNRQNSLKLRLRNSVRGAITGAIVLQIGLLIFPIYIRNFANGLVGQVTSVLAFLIFFYIIALVTLIGAEVNAYFTEGIHPTAQDLITRSSRNP